MSVVWRIVSVFGAASSPGQNTPEMANSRNTIKNFCNVGTFMLFWTVRPESRTAPDADARAWIKYYAVNNLSRMDTIFKPAARLFPFFFRMRTMTTAGKRGKARPKSVSF